MGRITTFTGRSVYPTNLLRKDVCIEDIAHSLSCVCRFGGHCRQFYSVAQHSMLVSSLLPEALQLHGLLHDAAEAYLGDVCRPVKAGTSLFGESFDRVERWTLMAIHGKFGLEALSAENAVELNRADMEAFHAEYRDLMVPVEGFSIPLSKLPVIVPLLPVAAERMFLEYFRRLHRA